MLSNDLNLEEAKIILDQEKTDLYEMIDKLKSYPNKIRYPVKIPVSKVAFREGFIVHTNEIKVLEPGQTEANLPSIDFCSHFDAMEKLKKRIEEIDRNFIHMNVLNLKDDKKNSTTSQPQQASESTTKPAKGILKSTTKKSETKQSTITETESTLITATKKDSSKSNDVVEPFFEIREYLDEEGKIMDKTEMVDISKQLQYLQNMSEELESISNSEEDNFIRELSLNADKFSDDSGRQLVEQAPDMSDFFVDLERKTSKSSSNGWKAGFLGSSSKQESKKPTSASPSKVDNSNTQDLRKGVSFNDKSNVLQEYEVRAPPINTKLGSTSKIVQQAPLPQVPKSLPEAPTPPEIPESKPILSAVSMKPIEEHETKAPKPLANIMKPRTFTKPVSNNIVEKFP